MNSVSCMLLFPGTEHIALHINVEDRSSVETAFKDVTKQFSKPPTIIVNSAGIMRNNLLMKHDDSNFDDIINVNLKGTFLVMQIAVKAMIEGNATKNSSIINISSIAARGRHIGVSTYSAKAGVIAMTASLEFGQFEIRVNAVLPGLIETPMIAQIFFDSGAGAGSGIGREVCRVLAREGANVVAADQNIKAAQETVAYLEEGAFLVTQTAVKAMIEGNASKNSSIINISSILAKHCNFIGHSIYCASKAGVIAMTKCASLEFGQFGIRVNAVLPGLIITPMTANIPGETMEMLIKNVLLQRAGKPEEVAEVIVFLASDRSSYINGASIEVTGGIN
ncbi:Estradiol 17-beta-dehydrogenase 8 [Camponotus floridanus]|uniref:Estradiol 17-beta-dehydrogenase 8 n=1 Tax=Camponotus floridanus TaxID=104421 RepID=E1ZXE1_CAMFO|nr:Estradiol 17-beta-dehydrogenase 8 [Camponotus floridanus]